MTFDEIKSVEISAEDRHDLASLKDTKEWKTLRRLVEGFMLQLSGNLLVGTEINNGDSVEELKALRGFSRYWKLRVVDLIENPIHHKPDENENKS